MTSFLAHNGRLECTVTFTGDAEAMDELHAKLWDYFNQQ